MRRDHRTSRPTRGRSSTIAATRRRCALAFALSAILSAVGGCGRPQTAPVSGTITVDGAGVGPGTVIFLPAEGSRFTDSAMGHFGADGRYQLSTFSSDDGAILGTHRVIVQARADTESEYGEESDIDQNAIPLLYADPKMSGLTAEVQPGENTIDLELEPGQ